MLSRLEVTSKWYALAHRCDSTRDDDDDDQPLEERNGGTDRKKTASA